jgi:2-desacetyl-2-hydroxyethyl bacteriochlorophyllide A dehydrogenase
VTGAVASGSTEAVVFTAPERAERQRRPVPRPLPGHVLVRTAFVGLCGTDRELYLGTHPYLAGGQSAYPLIPGHEWSGTVVATGDDVRDLAEGDRVVGDPFVTCGRCRYCRAQRRNVCAQRSEIGVRGAHPGAAAGLFSVPEQVCTQVPGMLDLQDAVLAEPAVTVLAGLRRTRAGHGDRLAVIGTGTLGLIAVAIARASGAQVHAVGLDAVGLEAARGQGADTACLPADAEPGAFDVVVEAAGAPDGLAQAVRLAAPAARVALLGMPSLTATAPDTTELVAKDLEIYGVLGGVEHYPATLRLIAGKVIDASALIDRVYPAADAAQAYQDLAHHPRQRPKLLLGF